MHLPTFLLLILAYWPLVAVSLSDPREQSANENTVQQRLIPLFSSSTPSPPLIDSLRQRYLARESDLWHLIDSGIDNAYVLEHIHVKHLQFFTDNFGEFNVTFNDYAFDRQIQLRRAIADINGIVSLVMQKSLRQNPLSFDERATVDTAQLQLDLTQQQNDAILNITHGSSSDFYMTIKNVSNFDKI